MWLHCSGSPWRVHDQIRGDKDGEGGAGRDARAQAALTQHLGRQEDLLIFRAKLEKCIGKESGADTATASDILTLLEGRSLTRNDLKRSKIGRVVNKLRKHADENVARLSKALIRSWKEAMLGKPGGKTSVGTKVSNKKTKSGPAPSPAAPSAAAPSAKAAPRGKNVSGGLGGTPEPAKTGDGLRDRIRARVFGLLGATPHCARKTEKLESAMASHFGEGSPKYKSFYRTLMQNLRDKNNPDCRVMVLTLPADKLVRMDYKDFASKDLKARRAAEEESNALEARTDLAEVHESDEYKCGECKQRKCSFFQMQTRASDEPMTTFVTCLNCGNEWRF